MSGIMVVVVARSHCRSPGSIPRSSKIFSPLWIAPEIILECEGSMPSSPFHGWLPVGEVKLFCTTLKPWFKFLLRSEVGWDRVGCCLQEWRGKGEILEWSRCCSPIWSNKQVESAGTVVEGYVGGLLRLDGKRGWCFVSKYVGEQHSVCKWDLGIGS